MTMEKPDFSKYPALDEHFNGRKDQYILDENNKPVLASLMEWAEFFEGGKNRIVKQETVDGYWISTVFIGITMNFYSRNDENFKPAIFETMIFRGQGGESLDYMDRAATWDEALECHAKAIEFVKAGCPGEEDDS